MKNKKLMVILISVISVIVAAAIGVGVYFIIKNSRPDLPDPKYEIDGSDGEHTKLY